MNVNYILHVEYLLDNGWNIIEKLYQKNEIKHLNILH